MAWLHLVDIYVDSRHVAVADKWSRIQRIIIFIAVTSPADESAWEPFQRAGECTGNVASCANIANYAPVCLAVERYWYSIVREIRASRPEKPVLIVAMTESVRAEAYTTIADAYEFSLVPRFVDCSLLIQCYLFVS